MTIFPLTGIPNDLIINGPKNIISEWPSLKSAGFKTIDAILPNPVNREEAYFFRGDEYALINIQQGELFLFALSSSLTSLLGPNNDYIVDGPRPNWQSLKDTGFPEIIMILPNPSNPNEAYFFSREEYALISIRGMFVMLRAATKD